MYNVQVHPQNKMQQNQFKWYCCYFFYHFLNNFDWKGNNHKNSNGCNSSRSLNYIIAAQYHAILHDYKDKIRFNMHNIRVERRKLHQFTKPVTFRFTRFRWKCLDGDELPSMWKTNQQNASVTVYLPANQKTIVLCDA